MSSPEITPHTTSPDIKPDIKPNIENKKPLMPYWLVSGVLETEQDCEHLLTILHQFGLGEEDISVLMTDKTKKLMMEPEEKSKVAEGTAVGGVTGGLLGAVIGSLTMVGAVALPGVGFLATGPVVGALTGGIVGTATGSLAGALIGLGIPEHEIVFMEESLQQAGKILVIVRVPEDKTNEMQALFEHCGAAQIKAYAA